MFSAASLKIVHVSTVVLTLVGFVARALAAFGNREWIRWRSTRIAKDTVDTVLLASAIGLAIRLGVSPLSHGWLAAKIVGLVLYLVLGFLTLRAGLPPRTRAAALLGALGVFGFIVSVALTKDPRGFLVFLFPT